MDLHQNDMPVTNQDHSTGFSRSPVQMIQYADYACPFSAAAFPVIRETLSQFNDQVHFVYRQFPLIEIHPTAFSLACLAEAAAHQGKFWRAHQLLFEAYGSNPQEMWALLVADLGLDVEQLQKDVESREVRLKVIGDMKSGVKLSVRATPSFLLNGRLIQNEWHKSGLQNEIQAILRERKLA